MEGVKMVRTDVPAKKSKRNSQSINQILFHAILESLLILAKETYSFSKRIGNFYYREKK